MEGLQSTDDGQLLHFQGGSLANDQEYAAAQEQQQVADLSATINASKVPTARKEEVQRLLGQCLVVKCHPEGPYAAPVVIMAAEESNIYMLVEKHFKIDYLNGPERFWKLVRTDLQLETWRPRVQGAQLKALAGARLPETEYEMQNIARVVQSLQDCLKPDSSPDIFMQDLQRMILQIQAWWENRNRRPDGSFKRGAPSGMPGGSTTKRQAVADELQAFVGRGGQLMAEHGSGALPLGAPLLTVQAGYLGLGGRPAANNAAAGAIAALEVHGNGFHQPLGQNPLSVLLNAPSAPIMLDVGGRKFRTSVCTLTAVEGSLLWQAFHGIGQPQVVQRLPAGELFIDRDGAAFAYILEYLRACVSGELAFPLPNDSRELQAVAREAVFYQLSALLQHIHCTSIMPQPGTRAFYDTLYLETGFSSIEGPHLRDMERRKIVVIQQLNHVLHVRSTEGFYVDNLESGVKQRQAKADAEGHDGGMQHNMYWNVLLKKVVPVLPGSGAAAEAGQEDEDQDHEQHHSGSPG